MIQKFSYLVYRELKQQNMCVRCWSCWVLLVGLYVVLSSKCRNQTNVQALTAIVCRKIIITIIMRGSRQAVGALSMTIALVWSFPTGGLRRNEPQLVSLLPSFFGESRSPLFSYYRFWVDVGSA